MKTRFLAVIALMLSVVMLLASCGVPDEKLDSVANLYEELVEKYNQLVNFCDENGIFEADPDLATGISEYGTMISDYGIQITEDLPGMNEGDVDTLISDLEEIIGQVDEVYNTYYEAVNG